MIRTVYGLKATRKASSLIHIWKTGANSLINCCYIPYRAQAWNQLTVQAVLPWITSTQGNPTSGSHSLLWGQRTFAARFLWRAGGECGCSAPWVIPQCPLTRLQLHFTYTGTPGKLKKPFFHLKMGRQATDTNWRLLLHRYFILPCTVQALVGKYLSRQQDYRERWENSQFPNSKRRKSDEVRWKLSQ